MMSNSDGRPDISHAKAWLTEISRELKLMSPYAADGRYVSKDLLRLVGPDSRQSLCEMAATIDDIVARAEIGAAEYTRCEECGNETRHCPDEPGPDHLNSCSLWTGTESTTRKAT